MADSGGRWRKVADHVAVEIVPLLGGQVRVMLALPALLDDPAFAWFMEVQEDGQFLGYLQLQGTYAARHERLHGHPHGHERARRHDHAVAQPDADRDHDADANPDSDGHGHLDTNGHFDLDADQHGYTHAD
jgi:hypothetical protein